MLCGEGLQGHHRATAAALSQEAVADDWYHPGHPCCCPQVRHASPTARAAEPSESLKHIVERAYFRSLHFIDASIPRHLNWLHSVDSRSGVRPCMRCAISPSEP